MKNNRAFFFHFYAMLFTEKIKNIWFRLIAEPDSVFRVVFFQNKNRQQFFSKTNLMLSDMDDKERKSQYTQQNLYIIQSIQQEDQNKVRLLFQKKCENIRRDQEYRPVRFIHEKIEVRVPIRLHFQYLLVCVKELLCYK